MRVVVGNSASVSRKPSEARAIWDALAWLAQEYNADAVVSTECADFNVRVNAPDWAVPVQEGAVGSPQSALAAYVRKPATEAGIAPRLQPITPKASSPEGNVRERGVLRIMVGGIPLGVCHAPYKPVYMRQRYNEAVANLDNLVLLGDFNQKNAYMTRVMKGRRIHSDRLMHAVVPKRYASTLVKVIDRAEVDQIARRLTGGKVNPRADHEVLIVDIGDTGTTPPPDPKPEPPKPPTPLPTEPGVTPSEPDPVEARRRLTWRSKPKWRYFATRLDGKGGVGEVIHPELPLSNVSIDDVLTGVNGLSGTINPKFSQLVAPDGRPLLEEWGTAIWAEESDNILGGGILVTSDFDGPQWNLECVGLTGYPTDMPYATEKFFVETDAADIFRHIWSHIQGQPNGNVGLEIDPMKTGVLIGIELEQGEFDSQEGPLVFESGAYKLAWYQDHDLGENLATLAADTAFDWREEHYWDGDVLRHFLRLGYPTLGERRDDLRFVIGENILVRPQITRAGEDYADESWVLGSGEGVKMLRGIARRDMGRLRRVAVSSDSSLRNQRAVNKQAEREQAWRWNLADISEVIVADHPHAPIGSILPGDEIRIEGETPWLEIGAYYRVLRRTIKPQEPGRVTLEILRSDRIAE